MINKKKKNCWINTGTNKRVAIILSYSKKITTPEEEEKKSPKIKELSYFNL